MPGVCPDIVDYSAWGQSVCESTDTATSYVPTQQALGPAPTIHFFPRSGPRKIRTSVSGGIMESGDRRILASNVPEESIVDLWSKSKESAIRHSWHSSMKVYHCFSTLRSRRRASMALRVACSVKVSDSFGIPVTKGLIIQPSPEGMSRVSEATSLWT